MNESKDIVIEVQHLAKLYGLNKSEAVKLLEAGASKEEVQKKAGVSVGLWDINLKIPRGQIFVIIGLSGSGKSTLVRCFNLLNRATSGRILFDGKDISTLSKRELLDFRRSKISMVFQSFGLMSHRDVLSNVGYGLEVKGIPREAREKKAMEVLSMVGLSDWAHQSCGNLSGGMRQRVGIARALANDPEVLLMDEPFSALDGYLKDILQRDMQNFLKDYKGDMIMVTHSRDEAYKFCSQLTLLHNGKEILTGETRQIFEKPQYLEAAKLTGCKNFSAVQKMGPHQVYALDWELMFHIQEEVSDEITHVGIRGHWMRPANESGENVMAVQVEEYIENTFEHQYLIRNKEADGGTPLWWMCQKKDFQEKTEDRVPAYLYFPPEHLMLLKK